MQRPALSTLPTQTPRPDPLRLLVSHAQSPATDAANALPCTRWSPRESRSHVRPRQSMPSVSAAVTRPGPTPAAGRPLCFSELPHVLPRSVHNSPSPSLFLSSFFLAHSCAHSDNAPPFLPPASALLQPTKLREPALPGRPPSRPLQGARTEDTTRFQCSPHTVLLGLLLTPTPYDAPLRSALLHPFARSPPRAPLPRIPALPHSPSPSLTGTRAATRQAGHSAQRTMHALHPHTPSPLRHAPAPTVGGSQLLCAADVRVSSAPCLLPPDHHQDLPRTEPRARVPRPSALRLTMSPPSLAPVRSTVAMAVDGS
ncbi:hypothetical protein AcW2_005362 [Taiwanofungus camphoratus]|nr:hypothetical protein AcW2_005362 [Antrodia cinnamomea]